MFCSLFGRPVNPQKKVVSDSSCQCKGNASLLFVEPVGMEEDADGGMVTARGQLTG